MLLKDIRKIADTSSSEIKEFALRTVELAEAHGVADLALSPNELPAEHYAAIYAHRLERLTAAGAKFCGVRESVLELQVKGKTGVRVGILDTPKDSAVIFVSASLAAVVGAMIFEKRPSM